MNSIQLFKTWSSFKALYGDFEYLIVITDDIIVHITIVAATRRWVAIATRQKKGWTKIYVGELNWLPIFCYISL